MKKLPSWLVPSFDAVAALPVKRARTVADKMAQQVAAESSLTRRCKKWYHSEKGKAWREANRERRNAYFLKLYHENPLRRAYITAKRREYREAQKANG
jgi:hypothetical protein